jgi:hypothetical protein
MPAENTSRVAAELACVGVVRTLSSSQPRPAAPCVEWCAIEFRGVVYLFLAFFVFLAFFELRMAPPRAFLQLRALHHAIWLVLVFCVTSRTPDCGPLALRNGLHASLRPIPFSLNLRGGSAEATQALPHEDGARNFEEVRPYSRHCMAVS